MAGEFMDAPGIPKVLAEEPVVSKGFNWVEGVTTVTQFVKAIATELTTSVSNAWVLKEPENLAGITDMCIVEVTNSADKTFYLKVERPADSLNHVLMQIGDKFDEATKDLVAGRKGVPARFAWYKKTTDLFIGDWLPVQYWLSFGADFMNLVVQGDPSPDIAPYNNYLISYAYVGALESYEGADDDTSYNFALTTGSDVFDESKLSTEYGYRTATGVTDISMLATRTAMPYQAHYPAFHTINPFMDRNFISASAYTHKHHLSEVVVLHAFDRERGKMKNLLVGDRSAVFHQDELIMDKGLPTEKIYKVFAINTPFCFLNNGPNVLYLIAIRKA